MAKPMISSGYVLAPWPNPIGMLGVDASIGAIVSAIAYRLVRLAKTVARPPARVAAGRLSYRRFFGRMDYILDSRWLSQNL
ncbi:hypothetical protein [Mesorhizobium sp. BR-1-1-10]|uniref:hypothetical protein n=1 Tax=Mesorhizobium sp. BR-1-1-10 TaxID=2876660 RepID=UPI001CD0921B|nr:hypothetical protein [Mesorhizobium sp. BR-1-1-10]MBZ9974039.1 hypothetical protein [Mesorhizobium sp. BR-1-1-10]